MDFVRLDRDIERAARERPLDIDWDEYRHVSGQRALRGVILPFADLLIGATALHHGCEVVTENIRHFEMIPDLVVRKLQLAFFCCAIKFPADDFLRAVIICGRSR